MGSPLAYEREGLDIRHIRELFGNPDLTRLKSDDVRTAYAKARYWRMPSITTSWAKTLVGE